MGAAVATDSVPSGFRLKTRTLIASTAPGSSPLPRATFQIASSWRAWPGRLAAAPARPLEWPMRCAPASRRRSRVARRRPVAGGARRRPEASRVRRPDRAPRRGRPNRPLGVEVEPDPEERGALLEEGQCWPPSGRRRGRAAPSSPVPGHLRGPELALHDALGGEPPEDEHLRLADLVPRDLERPGALERLVQARDDAPALDVVSSRDAGDPSLIFRVIDRYLYSRGVSLGLRRDVPAPSDAPRVGLFLTIRPIEPDNVPLFTDGMTTMSLRKWRSAGKFSRRPMPGCRTGLAHPRKKRSARSDEGGGPREEDVLAITLAA